MNVLLCDDDIIFLEKIKRQLATYNCKIHTFTSIEVLFNTKIIFDIAFLDIEFQNGMNGFHAVKFLRKKNKKCIISFFTNYDKYAIKGYDYRAFRYILKREPDVLINKRIKEVFKEYYRLHTTFSGSYNGYSFNVELDDIYYIQSNNHILTLHTTKGDFEIYKQMKDAEKKLCAFDFIRCHKSYIVNMKHIMVMRNDNFFILLDYHHSAIPIGITYKNKVEESYLNFVAMEG